MQKIQEMQVPWEKPMKKEIATQSSIFAWKIPQTESLVDYSPWGHKE